MESEFVVGLVGLAVSLLLHSQSISIPPTRLTPEGEVTCAHTSLPPSPELAELAGKALC